VLVFAPSLLAIAQVLDPPEARFSRTPGIEAQQPTKKTIDLAGRVVKETGQNALQDRRKVVTNLIHAIRECRKLADQPWTLRGSEYAHAVQEMNKAIDRVGYVPS
jgi:hypothetical protein